MRLRLCLFMSLLLELGALGAQPRIVTSYSDSLQDLLYKLPDTESYGDTEKAALLAEKILCILEKNGYPFAEIRLTEQTDEGNQPFFHLQVIANHYIVWDSIVVKGDAKISPKFLAPYLKIRKGKAYDENLVTQSSAALEALDYVTLLRKPSPSFTTETAALYLYLNKKNANSFDGYIGFSSKEGGRGLQCYGHLNLQLANSFGRGETFAVSWNRLRTNYQTLSLEGHYPCLFQSPFGLYGQFSLLRNDTNYYRLSVPVGVSYLLKAPHYLQIHYRYESGKITGNGSSQLQQEDYEGHYSGLTVHLKQLDNRLMPRKGFHWESCIEAGRKKNRETETVNLSWNGFCQGSSYLPLGGRWVQANRLLAGYIHDKQLYESNLFLLGGLRSLRGVEEQSLRASAYFFVSEEIRFFLNNNLFVQLFADAGWYERALGGAYYHDFPIGLGSGFSLQTKNGIFSMSYALAAHDNQGFKFKSSKISIGFNAFF